VNLSFSGAHECEYFVRLFSHCLPDILMANNIFWKPSLLMPSGHGHRILPGHCCRLWAVDLEYLPTVESRIRLSRSSLHVIESRIYNWSVGTRKMSDFERRPRTVSKLPLSGKNTTG
jgi:hypothetical protein